jgi:hypothetical protein
MSVEQQSLYDTFTMVFSNQLDFVDDISCLEYIVQFGKQHVKGTLKESRERSAIELLERYF